MSIYIFQPATGGGGGGSLEQTLSLGANVTSAYISTISNYWYWDTPSVKFADFSNQQGFYFDQPTGFLRVGDTTTGSGGYYNLEIDYNTGQIKFNDYASGVIAGLEYTSGSGTIPGRQFKIGDFNLGHYMTFLTNYTTANWDSNGNWLWVDYANDKIQIGSTDNFGNFTNGIRFINGVSLYFRATAGTSIINQTNNYTFAEDSVGGGSITFQGTGYVSSSAGGSSGQHLVVIVNGNTRKIPLFFP